MERRTINSWQWQEKLGYSQAIEVKSGERVLYCAGQTSTGPDGQPRFPGDMRARFARPELLVEIEATAVR